MMQKFRSAAADKSGNTRRSYCKAINCLETFLGTYTYSSHFPSEQTIADWFLNMRARGMTMNTALLYLDIASALFNATVSETGDDKPKVFGQFKENIIRRQRDFRDLPIGETAFKRILAVTRSASSNTDSAQCAADMLLYSLLNRAMPLSEVAKVKVGDIDTAGDAISVIVRRNAAPNRKYLFPLNQSKMTPRQLTENAERRVRGLFIAHNIPVVKSVDNTIRLIWACAAMKCGIPGSEIAAMVGLQIVGLPELSLCSGAEIPPQRQSALTDTVNTLFSDNPLRWYAMRLRSRVGFEDVEKRVRDLDRHILRPEFFYPLDEIRRRIGKKIVKDRQPVIRDIVFFRHRVTDIFPLFCKIGDLAWCYTTTGKPGGDYAPIPRSSFERFQETIGHFTPEYEVAPIGGFEPKEGETVVIVNGPLASYEFEVDKAKADADNVIFQLNMVGDNGFQWRTSAKKRQLGPASLQGETSR